MSTTTTQGRSGSAGAERVAVIAVHGVADQRAGDTARAIASLMVNAGHPAAHYTQGDCDSFILAVPLLPSMVPSRPLAEEGTGEPQPSMRQGRKALQQSARSDFQRPGWITAPAAREGPAQAKAAAVPEAGLRPPPPSPPSLVQADPGLAFSDYLLFKAQRNGATDEAYEGARIRMTRRAEGDARVQQVDVHEMYWADLSRLSGALPRIVTELFTMVFRLSRLGRDTVDQAARSAREAKASRKPAARWLTWLARVQIALDWAFASVLANLFVQLLLVGLLIAGLGQAVPHVDAVRKVVAWALPALGAWWFCYRYAETTAGRIATIASALAAVGLLHWLPAHWVLGVAWLALLALLCDYGLRVANARFPAARSAGLFFLAATAVALLGLLAADHAADLHSWVRAGVRTVEFLLLAIVAWWAAAAVALLAWLVLGELAARDGPAARASVATGRLGLFVSVAAFVALVMALWALLTTLVEMGGAYTDYRPLFFAVDGSYEWVKAAKFLHDRYENSTESFALAAGLTLGLVVYLVVVFVPSVLAEIKATVGTSQTLGRWLSAGYRQLDTFVALLVIASVLAACGVGVLLLLARFDVFPGGWIGALSERVAGLSKDVLKPLVLSAATAAAALSIFGGLLSRYAPWLRAPLDVALDVDNHFREFPRRAIPRARIFSRYVALLEHVAAQGYDRVVIVAHSQGTVISAELLRYLQHRAGKQGEAGASDRVTRLWSQLRGRVDLLTAGCPLRQLYAARFPELYAWALQARQGQSGPAAADVGVGRWINVYTTGDYVGRWLWCDAPPAVDTVNGKPTLYDPCCAPGAGTSAERDVCLGSGAHTHYFEQPQPLVAACIDQLVAGR